MLDSGAKHGITHFVPQVWRGRISKPKDLKGGIIGPLIGHAMADRQCPKCGVIPLSDFSKEMRSQITRSRFFFMALIIVGFIAFVSVFVFVVLSFENPR